MEPSFSSQRKHAEVMEGLEIIYLSCDQLVASV